MEISPDPVETADASSTWIRVGTIGNSSGTMTFTPSLWKILSTATVLQTEDTVTCQGRKVRVQVQDEGTPAVHGTLTVYLYTKATS
jgi:hypothetical protein